MLNINLIANFIGILALLASAIAIAPGALERSSILVRSRRVITKIAYYGLLCAVGLGLVHGLLMTQRDRVDFYQINTYWVYAGGLFAFNSLAFIALMYAELKSRSTWLNYLRGGALLLLIFHLGQHL